MFQRQKNSRENTNRHFVFSNYFFRKSRRLLDNVGKCNRVGDATDDNIIRRMRISRWVTKTTNIHSECVVLIAFPL